MNKSFVQHSVQEMNLFIHNYISTINLFIFFLYIKIYFKHYTDLAVKVLFYW
jgi:hypothetical protein